LDSVRIPPAQRQTLAIQSSSLPRPIGQDNLLSVLMQPLSRRFLLRPGAQTERHEDTDKLPVHSTGWLAPLSGYLLPFRTTFLYRHTTSLRRDPTRCGIWCCRPHRPRRVASSWLSLRSSAAWRAIKHARGHPQSQR